MMSTRVFVACAVAATSGACGLYVPEKNMLSPDYIIDPETGVSSEGEYENKIVRHLLCEIASGIWRATNNKYFNVGWLKSRNWGTSVTLTITREDQSSLNPSVSFIDLLPPLKSAQTFILGAGANGSANATRTETIQFTYVNNTLWQWAKLNTVNGDLPSCSTWGYQNGVMIDGDLKISDFIYDKSVIATKGNVSSAPNRDYPFNTFTENLSFVATLGGSITPTWKLTYFTANTAGTFLSATRTNTDQLTITIGPIGTYASNNGPAELSTSAQNQHNTQVQAGANATAINGGHP
jgi:hypothetical protein